MRRSAALGLVLAAALASGSAGASTPAVRGVEAAPAQPRIHGPPSATASLLAAERAFAARSAAAGAETAFREFVDPDGLSFDGGEPLRGVEAVARSHADGGRLLWAPAEVFASAGGDMGSVWGVWSYTPKGSDAVLVTGRYVTVWRRDAAGAWKAIIDIGAPDAAAAGPPPKT